MIELNVTQGSQEWLAARAKCFTASEAPAMMGVSTYKTRAALLAEKATGIQPEIDAATQARFNAGHQAEADARPIAESIIGEELYPVTATTDDGKYLASSDGATMLYDIGFEHKLTNAKLVASVQNGIVPDSHKWQLVHQAMVFGFKKILFCVSDGAQSNFYHCWFEPTQDDFDRLLAGWAQFEADLANWQPTEAAAPVQATPTESLPAVVVQVQGALTVSGNLSLFGDALRSFIERIPQKPATDQEFADCEAACKSLKKAEEALEQAESSALAQISDVETMRRMVADLKNLARQTRLANEKMVKAEKENRKTAKVMQARQEFETHVQRLQSDIKAVRLVVATPDFGAAIKGLSSLASIDNALTAALLEANAAASRTAGRVINNLLMLDSLPDYAFLFADRQDLSHKESETLELIIEKRVADHKQAEAARLEQDRQRIEAEAKAKAEREAQAKAQAEMEAERARIRAEEQHKAQMEAAERMKAEQEEAAKAKAEAEAQEKQRAAEQQAAAPANDPGQTMNLGQINAALGFTVSADFLASLGINPVRQERAAKLYDAARFPTICRLIQEHLANVMRQGLKLAA